MPETTNPTVGQIGVLTGGLRSGSSAPAAGGSAASDSGLRRAPPYPVAALIRRTRNAKSSRDLHDIAFNGWEASMRLAVAAKAPSDATMLFEPSTGSWAAALRMILSDRKIDDPHLRAVYALFSRVGAGVNASPMFVTPKMLFEFIAAYRNQLHGHGAVRGAEFYDSAGEVLLNGLEAAWRHWIFLPEEGELVYVESVELDTAGQRRARIYLLKGGEPMLENRLGTADIPEGLRPNRLYLRVERSFYSLHPWLLYDDKEERERVLYYNGRNKYLDFISGETPRVEKLQELFPSLYKDLDALFKGKAATILSDQAMEPAENPNDFGDYEIIGELGRGGMATVCLAKQKSLDRRVALKIPLPGAANDPVAVQRFAREIQVLSQCDHPNVVKILDSGVHNGTPFYVMEYIEGADLARISKAISLHGNLDDAISSASLQVRKERAELLKVPVESGSKPMLSASQIRARQEGGVLNSMQRMIGLFRDAARGLHHLHQHNIIHRDIKPGNLMLTEGEHRIVVMDLGLAALSNSGSALSKDISALLGTLRYMAPEQLQRQPLMLDRRADIYSLCATFYEMLARKPFHDGVDQTQLLHQIVYEEPLPLGKANPMVPRDIQMIVQKGISKDPRQRYQTAEELAADLNHYLKGEPIAARDPSLAYLIGLSIKKNKALFITAAVALLMVAAVGAFALILYRGILKQESDLAKKAERDALTKRAQEQLSSGGALESNGKFGQARKNYEGAKVNFAALGEPVDEANTHLDLLYLLHRPPIYYFDGHRSSEQGGRGRIYSVAMSPANDALALSSGEEDGCGVVKLWDLRSGQEAGKYLGAPGQRVAVARFTPDGKKVLLSGWDCDLTIWDIQSGDAKPFSAHPEFVASIAFSANGKFVATGSYNGVIRMFELAKAREAATVDRMGERGLGAIRALSFSGNELLCSGGSEGVINIWKVDPKTGAIEHVKPLLGTADASVPAGEKMLSSHKGGINALTFADDGQHIVSCGDDRLMKIWNVADGAEIGQAYGHQSEVVALALYDRDAKAVSVSGTTLRIWDLAKISEPFTLDCGWHESAITSVAVLPGGKRVLTGSADGSLMMWNLPFKRVSPFSIPDQKSGSVYSVDLSAKGSLALSSNDNDTTVHLWDGESGIQLRELKGLDAPLHVVNFSSDEKQVFAIDRAGRILAWKIDNLSTNAPARTLHEGVSKMRGGRPFMRGTFSPDGRLAALNASEAVIDVVDLETGKTISALIAEDLSPDKKPVSILVGGLSFSGDGSRILTSNMEGTLRLWDAATGKKLQEVRTPGRSAIFGLVLSHDGKRAFAGGMDFVCRLWNLEKGEEIRRFEGHNNSITGVAHTNRKRQIATGSMDQSIRIWDVEDGRELYAFHGLKGSVSTLTYSDDGEVLMFGCRNGVIEKYDFHQAEELRKLEAKIKDAQARLKNNKDDVEALNIVGEWLSMQGAWKDATERMDEARRLNPGAFDSYSMLGKCYWLRAKNEANANLRAGLLKHAEEAYRIERDRTNGPGTELTRLNLILNAVEEDRKGK